MINNFIDIGLLITHYNRSRSLENLLETFSRLGFTFEEIVVSDDGSERYHLDHLKFLQTVYSFKLVTVDQNQGLGHNINKGQEQVTAKYTLYVQEDFVPTEHLADNLSRALLRMENTNKIDLIRFWSYFRYPYLGPEDTDGFAEMIPNLYGFKYNKMYCYSDTPHLRRTSFFEKFGRYEEDVSGDETEYRMCLNFIRNKGNALFFVNSTKLFKHHNTQGEPSTMDRPIWMKNRAFLYRLVLAIYKQFRFNYDLHFRNR